MTPYDSTGRYLFPPAEKTEVWKLIENSVQPIHFNVVPQIDDGALASGLLYYSEMSCKHALRLRQAAQAFRRAAYEATAEKMWATEWAVQVNNSSQRLAIAVAVPALEVEIPQWSSNILWPSKQLLEDYIEKVGAYEIVEMIRDGWI